MTRFFKGNIAVVFALVLITGCSSRVETQDSIEMNYPAIRKARAKLREGDRQSALELLNKAVEEKPKLAQAHLEAAQLYDGYYNDYARAIYHYERYLELRPDTEKREMIEGFIRKAKIAFAASIADQIPGMADKMQALQTENAKLAQALRQVRENLARQIAASPRSVLPAPERQARSGQEGAKTEQAGTSYRVQQGETLSAIAAKVYQDPNKWRVIYDANRGTLISPEKLGAGQLLVIPR